MKGLRRRVSLVALLWLLSHVVTLATAVAGLCCHTSSAEASVEDDICCKGLAPGQMCPLHKHGSHKTDRKAPVQVPGGCAIRGGCDPAAAALDGVTLITGVLPDLDPSTEGRRARVESTLDAAGFTRSILPDSPPPRS